MQSLPYVSDDFDQKHRPQNTKHDQAHNENAESQEHRVARQVHVTVDTAQQHITPRESNDDGVHLAGDECDQAQNVEDHRRFEVIHDVA